MKIAFHLATPPAPLPELDASWQEIESLRRAFGGPVCHLYPGDRYRPWIRRRRLSRRQVEEWLALDREVDIHHVVSDRVLDFAVLASLKRPVIWRLLTPVEDLATVARVAGRGPLVVSAPTEAERLREALDVDVTAIAPGIEIERFANVPPPGPGPFTVLFASAPWTRRQFGTKGLDPLLQALQRRPALRLILLWRGVLLSTIKRKLQASGLVDRTELFAEIVKPEEILARVHTAVLAPSSPRVVKAFPHSLLEALAAGRPVVTSGLLALGEWVEERGCGLSVAPSAAGIGAGLDTIEAGYQTYRLAAAQADMSGFSTASCIAAHRALYERVLASADCRPAANERSEK